MSTHKHTDVTLEEFEQMQKHHRKFSYTNDEQAELFNLVRKYINPHQNTCFTCTNNLREAKNSLNTFYLLWMDEIQARFSSLFVDSGATTLTVEDDTHHPKLAKKKKTNGTRRK